MDLQPHQHFDTQIDRSCSPHKATHHIVLAPQKQVTSCVKKPDKLPDTPRHTQSATPGFTPPLSKQTGLLILQLLRARLPPNLHSPQPKRHRGTGAVLWCSISLPHAPGWAPGGGTTTQGLAVCVTREKGTVGSSASGKMEEMALCKMGVSSHLSPSVLALSLIFLPLFLPRSPVFLPQFPHFWKVFLHLPS